MKRIAICNPLILFYRTMKFIIREPKSNLIFLEQEKGWILSEQINSKGFFILGLIIGIILTSLFEYAIKSFTLCSDFSFSFYKKLYLIIILIPLHEFIHLLFFPKFLNSEVGFSLRTAVFFVTTNEIFSKSRLISSILMPLLLLTIFPFIFLFFIRNDTMAYFAAFNLLGSGVDIVSLFLVLKQPKNHLFRFGGSNLYIKREGS